MADTHEIPPGGITKLTIGEDGKTFSIQADSFRILDPSEVTPPLPMSAKDTLVEAIRAYIASAGVPQTEFDPDFVVKMLSAMMVSYHKYGRVADAYPLKFKALADITARRSKYLATSNKHFLVDVANFAMIEAMHPEREGAAYLGNDAADSPGRVSAATRGLVQQDNSGARIMGETILHIPGDESPL